MNGDVWLMDGARFCTTWNKTIYLTNNLLFYMPERQYKCQNSLFTRTNIYFFMCGRLSIGWSRGFTALLSMQAASNRRKSSTGKPVFNNGRPTVLIMMMKLTSVHLFRGWVSWSWSLVFCALCVPETSEPLSAPQDLASAQLETVVLRRPSKRVMI